MRGFYRELPFKEYQLTSIQQKSGIVLNFGAKTPNLAPSAMYLFGSISYSNGGSEYKTTVDAKTFVHASDASWSMTTMECQAAESKISAKHVLRKPDSMNICVGLPNDF